MLISKEKTQNITIEIASVTPKYFKSKETDITGHCSQIGAYIRIFSRACYKQIPGPTPKVLGSFSIGRGPRICILTSAL